MLAYCKVVMGLILRIFPAWRAASTRNQDDLGTIRALHHRGLLRAGGKSKAVQGRFLSTKALGDHAVVSRVTEVILLLLESSLVE